MERLDILLIDVLDRHKAHGRTRHRFRDGLGIAAVVFVRLDIRLHELGRHALHLVAMCAEASRPVVRAATGFHADAYGGQLRQKGHQVMPGQALAQDDLAPLIHAHRVKHALCNVDPEYAHLWFHWTRLLWLYGFTDRELIVAHCSRSAQGRVHFITTLATSYVATDSLIGINSSMPKLTAQALATRLRERSLLCAPHSQHFLLAFVGHLRYTWALTASNPQTIFCKPHR